VDGELDLAIEAGGRVVGDVQARHWPSAHPPGVYMLGIALFDAADRGRGIGREAVALLTRHLFEELGAERVEFSTDVENAAMRTVADRLGFRLEGVLRGFMPSGAGRRDYAMYAMTIDDYQTEKERWISTS
jgi:RimJ/RimL family protein N-acetyltransferase